MALAVVANVAAVAQLIEQATGLVSRIIRAVATARQNKQECEHLALRLSIIGDVLSRLPQADPVVERPLKELRTALGKAHELVLACQNRSAANQFFGARHHADSFREVNDRIYFLLSLFPMVNYAAITSHLARISPQHNGVPTTITVPPPGSTSASLQTLTVFPDYPYMFTWAEIVTATSNFAEKLGQGCSGAVYKGRLHDGPEVAVKVLDKHRPHETFVPELVITFRLRHDHIVRLVGWCEEEDDRMFVYEHISNVTLRDHLQRVRSSPVTAAPWRTRVAALLGASRAIQYLHCGAQPVVIHRNVSSSNILLDANWTPRLSGFGAAVYQAAGEERGGQLVEEVVGTHGYIDPEYSRTKRVSTTSDVYSFGVVMLEALMGEDPATLQLDSIRNGKLALKDVLDRRPSLDPTLPQTEALEIVADTAKRCICLSRMGRPDMSKVVANLEEALVVIRSHEPMSMARLSLIRRRTSEN
ncbi:hypothetical protein VPH35_057168 [Triticum aestivum]|uniref:probable serine/threonine-protein kinase PBL22 n=1 Tax=Triticum aestivum TaxID=4565 RepID=UPI00162B27BE|nr:probable serine/threonine-protein kinase PBL22 [Triticum aestivum]